MVLSQTPFTSVWKPLVVCYFLALKSGQSIFRDFWIPKLKKRSLSAPLRGALKTKQPRGERIKLVGGCPFITRAFIWTLGITKLRGRASQRFPFGPWLSLLRGCKQFSKSRSSLHLWKYITICCSGPEIFVQNIIMGVKKNYFEWQQDCGFLPTWKLLKLQIVLSTLQL